MKNYKFILFVFILSTCIFAQDKINVVTTLTTFGDIAKQIGGDKVDVSSIVKGNEDAHHVRPKPSFAVQLSKADLFVSTGLDLELWAPTLIDMSKNKNIRSGQSGYVSASSGIELLDKPTVSSRSEGGLHIYGNPHIYTSPLNYKNVAENIAIGLKKIDSKNSDYYQRNLETFINKIDEKLFGKKLVKLMGGKLLTKLAHNGKLITFLEKKEFKGEKLINSLDGWLKRSLKFRGSKIVNYHKNWVYFNDLLGLEPIEFVEPKPGIPPSPKHVEELIQNMKKNDVKVLIAASYFNKSKVEDICSIVGAKPVILPVHVNGNEKVTDVFKLFDFWISSLEKAFDNTVQEGK